MDDNWWLSCTEQWPPAELRADIQAEGSIQWYKSRCLYASAIQSCPSVDNPSYIGSEVVWLESCNLCHGVGTIIAFRIPTVRNSLCFHDISAYFEHLCFGYSQICWIQFTDLSNALVTISAAFISSWIISWWLRLCSLSCQYIMTLNHQKLFIYKKVIHRKPSQGKTQALFLGSDVVSTRNV